MSVKANFSASLAWPTTVSTLNCERSGVALTTGDWVTVGVEEAVGAVVEVDVGVDVWVGVLVKVRVVVEVGVDVDV